MMYAYYRLLGYPNATALPDAVLEDRLASMQRVGAVLGEAAPALLSTRRDDLVTASASSDDVALSIFEEDGGALVLYAVNGGSAPAAFNASVGNVSVAIADVGAWGVVRVDL